MIRFFAKEAQNDRNCRLEERIPLLRGHMEPTYDGIQSCHPEGTEGSVIKWLDSSQKKLRMTGIVGLKDAKPTYGKQSDSRRFFVGQVPLMNLTKEVYWACIVWYWVIKFFTKEAQNDRNCRIEERIPLLRGHMEPADDEIQSCHPEGTEGSVTKWLDSSQKKFGMTGGLSSWGNRKICYWVTRFFAKEAQNDRNCRLKEHKLGRSEWVSFAHSDKHLPYT